MEMSTTMFDVRIVMVSAFSDFYASPQVSCIFCFISGSLCLWFHSADRKYQDDDNFRKFRRRLFHASIGAILEPLRPAMTTPEVTRCPDGHFRRVIYGIGPYIADYPEQALLACIVQGWCPK
jgi:hypothetical protein